MAIIYRSLNINDITIAAFVPFNRYQEVTQCWRKIDGQWMLVDIPFIDTWGDKEKDFLVKCLQNTVATKGVVLGAFEGSKLVGFISIESNLFGSHKQYVQLSSIHVSHEYRGQKIGKTLFLMGSEKARHMGAEKLYISSHSAKETQAFYRGLGCIDAMEENQALADKEPCDCQLEFNLQK